MLSIVALVVAAAASGTAAVCQASAVARSQHVGVAGFLGGLTRDPRYLAGLGLVGLSFVASLVAVHALPLFLVQAGRASSLGVTAVLAAALLGSRLRGREVLALGAVALGLVGVGWAADPSPVTSLPAAVPWLVLAGAGVLVVASVAGTRAPPGPAGAGLLAVLAGACFGLVSVAARVLEPIVIPGVLGDPAAWAIGLAGLSGLVGGALAMQRGGVVLVTATMVAVESVLGAVLGVAVGDRPTPGFGWMAVAGFTVTVGGALLLARFGAPTVGPDGHEPPALATPDDVGPGSSAAVSYSHLTLPTILRV